MPWNRTSPTYAQWYAAIAHTSREQSLTSGQGNLTKRPHRRRTRTVQSYSPGGAKCAPPSNTCFLRPPESTYQTPSRSVQSFLHSSRQRFCTLQWASSFPSRLPLRMSNLDPRLMHATCFLGPTRVHNPNSLSIGSAVFAWLTIATDQPTYRQTDRHTTLLSVQ